MPATVAVLGGTLHVGLDEEELRRLAGSEDAALETSEVEVAAAEDLAAPRGITGRQLTLPALALKAGGPNVDKARAEILTTQGLAALLILV